MSHHVGAMLEAHPWPGHVDRQVLTRAIEEVFHCSGTCTSCADACLSEDGVSDLRKCIRLNNDCADICVATARVLTRQTEYDAPTSKMMVQACIEACTTCADECEKHAEMHEHCRICADACRTCARACEELLAAMK